MNDHQFSYEVNQRLAAEVEGSIEQPYFFRPTTRESEVSELDSTVLVDTIHDGFVLPDELMELYEDNATFRADCAKSFMPERDWGASAVASELARLLGLAGYREVIIARNVLDFGRFPGISRPWSAHLDRLAVSGPLAPYIQKTCPDAILKLYSRIANEVESTIEAKLQDASSTDPATKIRESRFIHIAIHTFDQYGAEGLRRPVVGLIDRSRSIEQQGHLPDGVFSRLFPDDLATFSADQMLKSAISCALERNYIPEVSDRPYKLPEGSVQMRTQVWLWFKYLRACFETQANEVAERLRKDVGEEDYHDYWQSLLNPNAVRSKTGLIRDLVEGRVIKLEEEESHLWSVRDVDEAVCHFLDSAPKRKDDIAPILLREYQYDAFRPSCLVIEIRKDAVCRMHPEFRGEEIHIFDKLNWKNIKKIAVGIAEGVRMYRELQMTKKSEGEPFHF